MLGTPRTLFVFQTHLISSIKFEHPCNILYLAVIFVNSQTARSFRLRSKGLTCASTLRAYIPLDAGDIKHNAGQFFDCSICHSFLFAIHWLQTLDMVTPSSSTISPYNLHSLDLTFPQYVRLQVL